MRTSVHAAGQSGASAGGYADLGDGGPTLLGAIELISPANKYGPAQRDAFVSKCAAYLQQGMGLILVDVFTERKANLSQELLKHLHSLQASAPTIDLYAVAYRPVLRIVETLDTAAYRDLAMKQCEKRERP